MRQESTATDNVYIHREIRFYLSDGQILSSKDLNWHQVVLSLVVMLELEIRKKIYRIRKSDLPSTFIEFIQFRTKGFRFAIDKDTGISVPEEFNSWSIGWSDGAKEYLAEIDFQTGDFIRKYELPISIDRASHFHPQSKILERGLRT